MRFLAWKHLPVLALAVTVAACNDDHKYPQGGKSESVAVSPSLGLVSSALVNVYEADGLTLIGTGTTAADGSVVVDYGRYRGPVVIEVVGGSDASYYDESAKATLAFPAGQSMRAMAIAPNTALAVTPLTHLAYEIALARG
ncbi:MAG: hypothetical protein JJ903_15060, partial [Spongiibacter sp.]